MSATIIRMERNSTESLGELQEVFTKAMFDFTLEQKYYELHEENGVETLLMVYEKYFMRNSSYACLIVQCRSSNGIQTATLIGTGGGHGVFNVSFGANETFAFDGKRAMEQCGFKEFERKIEVD